MINRIEKNRKIYYQMLIHDTIKTIIKQFHRKPHNFLNEHDFHHYCYHAFYRKKDFSRQYSTIGGERTSILHPEYPTLRRFRREGPIVGKGVRARYDMAILNPEFIESSSFDKVRCRNIRFFDLPKEYKSKNLFAALEFKFIIRHARKLEHEIKYDYFKLSNADEVGLKYMLVFTNTIEGEKGESENYFKCIKRDKGIKIIYVAFIGDGDKRKIRIKQYPYDWLKIDMKKK